MSRLFTPARPTALWLQPAGRAARSLLAPVALAVLAAAAGCSFIPAYERPAAPVAASYPTMPGSGGEAIETGAVSAAALPWQDFFADARLKSLIDAALVNNRDLRVAVLNIEQARAQFQIQRAQQFPALNGVASGSRQAGPNDSVTKIYSAGLSIPSYEIDFFGRVRSLKEAALAQYLATEEGRKTAQISLIANVANAYLAILAADELLAITRQTLATREESVRLNKLRFDAGVTSELDYQQALSLTEGARAVLAQTQRQRALAENALTLLVGRPVTAELPAGGDAASTPLLQTQVMKEVPAGLPSDLLVSRPDIRAAEQQLLAANANIGAARAAFFPNISLTAGVGSVSTQLSGLFGSGSWGFSLAPSLVAPIFNAGRSQAGLDSARAGQGIAVAQYEKAIQTAFREVADALAFRTTLADELRASQAQANAEATRLRLSDLRYRNGVSDYLVLLDAQRSLFTAQQAVVQARLSQLQSQVTLYRALGGGWKDNAAPGTLSTAPNLPANATPSR